MRYVLAVMALISFSVSAQLMSGDLLQEGRKLISSCDFKLSGASEGEIYFELSVDREGNVSSERLLTDKTTVVSTPTRYRAKELVHGLKFEPGTYYPHFHHVVVKITVKKAS